ncbi:MAG: radical SAM protein [Planctomycetes bacterium]|nr:radical SAM protein [Planctomycetota bacterium]
MMRDMADGLPRIDDRWILARRGPRHAVDPKRPYACLIEPECQTNGTIEDVATIFITNKACPFRCLMCDLWKHTTEGRVAVGDVVEQIRFALGELPPAPHVKLYNAGNFFDGQAIPAEDISRISELVRRHKTVIIECHPKLVDRRCVEFAGILDGRLEVAMGLETIDPVVLPMLNKRMTLADYERAARFLIGQGIGVRAFILLRAPFQSESEGLAWAKRSIEWAFEICVECCVVIPTRAGNGAMDELLAGGHFSPPSLESLEAALVHGLSLRRGRVFADLWDAERFAGSADDVERIVRIGRMNFSQRIEMAGAAARGSGVPPV